ncbi:hypothetical protein GGX14DRAFT_609793 [Mycena pura]|uniref:Uncharacterized protein n=1 Tax=Mycena pura TaxID=153505 RepID=A0AAD6VJR2_9AGAR|nr:hypothetical protein GGX14DRAFT_609793 [Mycena pura]
MSKNRKKSVRALCSAKSCNPLLKRCWHHGPQQRANATEISNVWQLEPLEWKKAVDGLTPPFSLFRRISVPLARRRFMSNISLQKLEHADASQDPASRFGPIWKVNNIEAIWDFRRNGHAVKIKCNLFDFRNDRYREIILGTETIGEIDYISRGVSRAIKMLSQDPGAQKAISYFSRHELSNSAEHFLNSIERLAAENYVPTTEDIFLLRVKTTGTLEEDEEVIGSFRPPFRGRHFFGGLSGLRLMEDANNARQ